MKSVISFPDRGHWGNPGWRGNCSGHVVRTLIDQFKPKLFMDACQGSGTSEDVCRELGIQYVGLDLHQGQDFTKDYLLSFLPRPADLTFAHPPYWSAIDYRTVGLYHDKTLIARDTSGCETIEEFLEKSKIMLLNMREATRVGGIYTTLIGDVWQKGQFRTLQADFVNMSNKAELRSVVIKIQHNCFSDKKLYEKLRYPTLAHEYLLIWERSKQTLVQLSVGQLRELKAQQAVTWRSLVRMALMKSGGTATVSDIYQEVEKSAGDKLLTNKHWQAKVRQNLQLYFEQVKRGVWAVPATV